MEPYIRRIRNQTGLGHGRMNGGEIGALPLSASSSLTFEETMEKDTSSRYEGFCIDLLNAIAKNLHFDYVIYEVEDGRFGAQDQRTGEWRGLVRELIDKVSDFVAVVVIRIIQC